LPDPKDTKKVAPKTSQPKTSKQRQAEDEKRKKEEQELKKRRELYAEAFKIPPRQDGESLDEYRARITPGVLALIPTRPARGESPGEFSGRRIRTRQNAETALNLVAPSLDRVEFDISATEPEKHRRKFGNFLWALYSTLAPTKQKPLFPRPDVTQVIPDPVRIFELEFGDFIDETIDSGDIHTILGVVPQEIPNVDMLSQVAPGWADQLKTSRGETVSSLPKFDKENPEDTLRAMYTYQFMKEHKLDTVEAAVGMESFHDGWDDLVALDVSRERGDSEAFTKLLSIVSTPAWITYQKMLSLKVPHGQAPTHTPYVARISQEVWNDFIVRASLFTDDAREQEKFIDFVNAQKGRFDLMVASASGGYGVDEEYAPLTMDIRLTDGDIKRLLDSNTKGLVDDWNALLPLKTGDGQHDRVIQPLINAAVGHYPRVIQELLQKFIMNSLEQSIRNLNIKDKRVLWQQTMVGDGTLERLTEEAIAAVVFPKGELSNIYDKYKQIKNLDGTSAVSFKRILDFLMTNKFVPKGGDGFPILDANGRPIIEDPILNKSSTPAQIMRAMFAELQGVGIEADIPIEGRSIPGTSGLRGSAPDGGPTFAGGVDRKTEKEVTTDWVTTIVNRHLWPKLARHDIPHFMKTAAEQLFISILTSKGGLNLNADNAHSVEQELSTRDSVYWDNILTQAVMSFLETEDQEFLRSEAAKGTDNNPLTWVNLFSILGINDKIITPDELRSKIRTHPSYITFKNASKPSPLKQGDPAIAAKVKSIYGDKFDKLPLELQSQLVLAATGALNQFKLVNPNVELRSDNPQALNNPQLNKAFSDAMNLTFEDFVDKLGAGKAQKIRLHAKIATKSLMGFFKASTTDVSVATFTDLADAILKTKPSPIVSGESLEIAKARKELEDIEKAEIDAERAKQMKVEDDAEAQLDLMVQKFLIPGLKERVKPLVGDAELPAALTEVAKRFQPEFLKGLKALPKDKTPEGFTSEFFGARPEPVIFGEVEAARRLIRARGLQAEAGERLFVPQIESEIRRLVAPSGFAGTRSELIERLGPKFMEAMRGFKLPDRGAPEDVERFVGAFVSSQLTPGLISSTARDVRRRARIRPVSTTSGGTTRVLAPSVGGFI